MSRFIKDDGSFDIERVGLSRDYLNDWYYNLMRVSWNTYLAFFIFAYLLMNSLFASFYFLAGDAILNAAPRSYWEAWAFSFQTSSTLGYGYLLPKSFLAHVIVVFDVLSGILFVAFATGVAFARFSRPRSKVLFTKNIILTKYDDEPSLVFRIGNKRSSHIVDARLNVVTVVPEMTKEKMEIKKIKDLKLERSHSPVFSLSWTVIHKIDEESPLYGLSLKEMKTDEVVFVISFTGIEDAFSQNVHERYLYKGEDLVEAKKFEDVLLTNEKGKRVLDFSLFHKIIN